MCNAISLTPGFSPVMVGEACQNRFNGFPRADKVLKRHAGRCAANTRLKPGVNEKRWMVAHFASLNKICADLRRAFSGLFLCRACNSWFQSKNAPGENHRRVGQMDSGHGQLSKILNRLPGRNGATSPPLKPM
jgi:hypothetical protein